MAEVIEQDFEHLVDSHPETLAHHLTEAGRAAQAILWWLRSTRHALQKSASVEAVAFAHRGIALLSELDNEEERRGTNSIFSLHSGRRSSPRTDTREELFAEVCERPKSEIAKELLQRVLGTSLRR